MWYRTAVSLIALCLAVSACAAPATVRPDLAPTGLSFDEDSVLEVSIQNQGNAEVPAGTGSLTIYIDGRPVGGYDLGRLSDQSFRAVDGEVTVRTNFRMAGSGRRVGLRVDSDNAIHESNEFQNTLTRTLDPPDATGPDFRVIDLSRNSLGMLRYKIRNDGNAASAGGLEVRVRVIVNESVAADLTPTVPLLAVGDSVTLSPSPSIPISAGDEVRVLLNTNHLLDEIDSTNNVREEVLPQPDFAPYATLLSEADIRQNIIWSDARVTAYPDWSPEEKADLREAILRRENGLPPALTQPPEVITDNQFSRDDAWNIYLVHIAQSLWVEVNDKVDWSLMSMSNDELSFILDSRSLVNMVSPTGYFYFSPFRIGNITAWNPRISWQFMRNHRFLRDTQLETIYALTDWMRAHLVHTSGDDDYEALYGYDGKPPADKVLYPLLTSPHKTAGCHGTSGLYSAVLRAANIPVERVFIEFRFAGHSRPIFPSVDRSMPHGDDPYTNIINPAISPVPIQEIFYTSAEMSSRFLSPAVDCDSSGHCNTPGEQAMYNNQKDHLEAAIDHLSARPLYEYAVFGESYLDDSLRGSRVGGMVLEFAEPFFTATERAAMIDQVEAEIRRIGGGDLAVGENIVIERYSRFGSNR